MNAVSTNAVLIICLFSVSMAAPLISPDHDTGLLVHGAKADGADDKPGVRGVKIKKQEGKAKAHHLGKNLQCGVTSKVGSDTDKYEDCPNDCPFFASNREDTEHCTFLCVKATECKRWNPKKPIADKVKSSKTCRGPRVEFCSEPVLDGTDACQKCQWGFNVNIEDGQCYFQYWTPLLISGIIISVLLAIVVAWVVDLCCRESINDEAVRQGEEWRSRSKLVRPRADGQIRKTLPITTNLLTTKVAGEGMLLHFRFQFFFIVWPLVLAMVWTALACMHNELFILGTRKFGTPRHNCILVAWGYETQQRLMWTKVLFLVIAYIFSFISFLAFSVSQQRKYNSMDATEKTMRDFVAEIQGLPELPGDQKAEEEIKKAVEAATGKKLVGVSIAWNYNEQQEKVEQAWRSDLQAREIEVTGVRPPALEDEPDPTASMGGLHKWMYNQEKGLLGPEDEEELDVPTMLKEMKSSDTAFAVFKTEEDKVEVVDAGTTVKFRDRTLKLVSVEQEPANLNWHNFDGADAAVMFSNFMRGLFKVYVPALLIWFFGFYVPYAISVYCFNYDNGAELPGLYSIIFTIVICGGNATMYVVCDICCDMIGFRYKDTKQCTYMLMYLVACMINVFLDMFVTYGTAYKIMVGLDFRTYHGERLSEITAFTEQFETYAMQRALGENTYAYAWPSTFFLCFVLEPFVTIMIPYQIGKVIVRTHREIQGACMESYLMAFEFDLGRYADILLNVFLGILIFYFPGGYIWTLFYFMCFSHCFIYCFDHWRVLQVIPYIKIVSNAVDWWAQVAMCACCATILMCLAFKANCESYVNYCLKDMELIVTCTIPGIAHFIVHFLLLVYLVPMLCPEPEPGPDVVGMTYDEVAKDEARTWFSMNPVHCLRSQHIYKQKPHCHYCYWGKEHLLEVNKDIGCLYSDEAAMTEDYSWSATAFKQSMGYGEEPEAPASKKQKA